MKEKISSTQVEKSNGEEGKGVTEGVGSNSNSAPVVLTTIGDFNVVVFIIMVSLVLMGCLIMWCRTKHDADASAGGNPLTLRIPTRSSRRTSV